MKERYCFKCGKRQLVKKDDAYYHCLNCHKEFHGKHLRDIEDNDEITIGYDDETGEGY